MMGLASEAMLAEHPLMKEHIDHLSRRRRDGDIGEAAYASLYFLRWQLALHGSRCAARKHKQDPRPHPFAWWDELRVMRGEDLQERLVHYLQGYGFLGVIANVPAALCAWLRKRWSLRVYEHIPAPEEVLHMQARGTRPVTILSNYPRLSRPVLNKANAYAFMVHDLEHAYKYFHDPHLHRNQKDFFMVIERALRDGLFDDYRRDPLFADRFDYLISDMNTHVMHSLQFLRAILVEHHLRRECKAPKGVLSSPARADIAVLMGFLYEALRLGPERSDALCSFAVFPRTEGGDDLLPALPASHRDDPAA